MVVNSDDPAMLSEAAHVIQLVAGSNPEVAMGAFDYPLARPFPSSTSFMSPFAWLLTMNR